MPGIQRMLSDKPGFFDLFIRNNVISLVWVASDVGFNKGEVGKHAL